MAFLNEDEDDNRTRRADLNPLICSSMLLNRGDRREPRHILSSDFRHRRGCHMLALGSCFSHADSETKSLTNRSGIHSSIILTRC